MLNNLYFRNIDQERKNWSSCFVKMSGDITRKRVMVTGGTGLVGMAIKHIIETEDKPSDEDWIFLSSKDADLT